MGEKYRQCPQGHYYQGDRCPYCRTMVHGAGRGGAKTNIYDDETETKTVVDGEAGYTGAKTEESGRGDARETVIGEETVVRPVGRRPIKRTVFGDDEEEYVPASGGDGGYVVRRRVKRDSRRLVGWLVSYTLDSMGVDFRLYEGRNVIGREPDCNITIDDKMVSGRHAVILYRGGRYSITDSQSSHGTFVNGEDIELEPKYIKDGDTIAIGETVFLFRTSI